VRVSGFKFQVVRTGSPELATDDIAQKHFLESHSTTGRKSSASSGEHDEVVPTLQLAESRNYRRAGMSSYAHHDQAMPSAGLYQESNLPSRQENLHLHNRAGGAQLHRFTDSMTLGVWVQQSRRQPSHNAAGLI
jgi:hypothetical protein